MCRRLVKMPLHLIDFYNFKPPADLVVNREESQAIRINAAKTSLVGVLSRQAGRERSFVGILQTDNTHAGSWQLVFALC